MDSNSSSSSSLQRSKSLIKSTSSLSIDENGLSTKIPTIVLTNTNDIESLNIISNDTTQSPSILYENDFDLYSMLKEMIKNPQQTKRDTKQVDNINAGFEKKVAYKSYKKHLTAQLNDISYTDGKIKWSLLNNFTPLYSKTIKCIGTNREDFELSEAIFLDLQPLSTRIKLMCKLIIIIQGACLERFGPPKMVQDRCVQFDGDIDLDTKNGTISRSESIKMSKIKSNSCENLLLDKSETNTTITTATTTFTVTNIDKNNNKLETRAVETLINQVERTEKNIIDDDDEETSNKMRRKRQDSAPDVIEKALFKKKGTSSEANSEDEKDTKTKSKSQKKYDLENYYRHRVSKYSLKDYASLPYYQYSGKHVTKLDKGVNTDESYLLTHVKETIQSTIENTSVSQKESLTTTSTTKTTSAAPKVDSSTSTTDLINDFYMGYYSKSQLLSDQSLFNAKSTLWNSFSNTLPPSEATNNEVKTEYFYSYSKEYYVKTQGATGTSPPPQQQIQQQQHPPQSHVSGFTIQTSPIPTNQMRPRPQKSSDWALYSQNSTSQRQQSMPKTIPSPTRRLVPNFINQTSTSSQQNKPANNVPTPPRSTNQNQTQNSNNNNNNNKSHISVASINLVKPAKF